VSALYKSDADGMGWGGVGQQRHSATDSSADHVRISRRKRAKKNTRLSDPAIFSSLGVVVENSSSSSIVYPRKRRPPLFANRNKSCNLASPFLESKTKVVLSLWAPIALPVVLPTLRNQHEQQTCSVLHIGRLLLALTNILLPASQKSDKRCIIRNVFIV